MVPRKAMQAFKGGKPPTVLTIYDDHNHSKDEHVMKSIGCSSGMHAFTVTNDSLIVSAQKSEVITGTIKLANSTRLVKP